MRLSLAWSNSPPKPHREGPFRQISFIFSPLDAWFRVGTLLSPQGLDSLPLLPEPETHNSSSFHGPQASYVSWMRFRACARECGRAGWLHLARAKDGSRENSPSLGTVPTPLPRAPQSSTIAIRPGLVLRFNFASGSARPGRAWPWLVCVPQTLTQAQQHRLFPFSTCRWTRETPFARAASHFPSF